MTMPVRIQLSRKKGFRLQERSRAINGLEAVKVDRATRFGNPVYEGMWKNYTAADAVRDFRKWITGDLSVRTYGPPPDISDLRGKNLACWCKPGEPCHADVLLEVANEPEK